MIKEIYIYRLWDTNTNEWISNSEYQTVFVNYKEIYRFKILNGFEDESFLIKKFRIVEVED